MTRCNGEQAAPVQACSAGLGLTALLQSLTDGGGTPGRLQASIPEIERLRDNKREEGDDQDECDR